MILREQTYKECGYYPESLSSGSGKKIVVQCDYCDAVFSVIYRSRTRATTKLNKDACNNCKYKKRADTNLLKYGVENVAQLDNIQKKRLNTLNNKEYFDNFNSKEHSAKIRKSVKDKYGVDNVFQLEEIKNRSKQTNLNKYGKAHHLQNQKILDKQKKTNLERYGCENVFQDDNIKNKAKQTNLQKYGVEYPTQNNTVKEKTRKTLISKGKLRVFDNKTRKDLAKELGKPYSTLNYQIRKYGIDTALTLDPKENALEGIISRELDKLNIVYTQHKTICGRKTDFILENYNIVIECDGLYWHSDLIIDDNNYHFEKLKVYENAGYRGLFFRQDEINNQLPIVMSIIKNTCKLNNKVYARKCKIVEVEKEEGKTFLNNNHLMGAGKGRIFGLRYDDELVTVLQINTPNEKHEISRFCHKLNTTVVGGFSRLLKYITNKLSSSIIFTFVDRRYGSGEYLSKLGFQFVRCSPSFRWVDKDKTYHRMKFPGNSGYEKGLTKIWDCGQTRWEKRILS